MPLYLVDLLVFSTRGWESNRQLIPNDNNAFQSLALDSVMVAIVSVIFQFVRKFPLEVGTREPSESLVPSLLKRENCTLKMPAKAKAISRQRRRSSLLYFSLAAPWPS